VQGILIFYGNTNDNHQLGTGYFVNQRGETAVKRVEIVSDRKSYIVLRRLWCNIILLFVKGRSVEKSDDLNDRFFAKLE